MRKPSESICIKIVDGGNTLTPEQLKNLARAIAAKHEQEKRDYKMYEQGLRDGRRKGIFGGLF